jgi:hypothetical protein
MKMKNNKLRKSLSVAVGGSFALSLAASPLVLAAENPFGMNELSGGYMVAEGEAAPAAAAPAKAAGGKEAPANKFDYGGDGTGAYAGGKVGTGVKDPAVCGTYTEAMCGEKGGTHLKKGKAAAPAAAAPAAPAAPATP